MEQDGKKQEYYPDEAPQINRIKKVEEPPTSKEYEQQQRPTGQSTKTDPLKDMHIESGEKINEYKP